MVCDDSFSHLAAYRSNMMRLEYKIRRRHTGGRKEDGKSSEKHYIVENESKKSMLPRKMMSKPIRLFPILAIFLSTFAIVFPAMQSRENWQKWYQIMPQSKYPKLSRRFPKFGTPEFAQLCNWTKQPVSLERNCTLWARPSPESHEGISKWISDIIRSHLQAKLRGCHLLIDYGPDVDIHQVITPIQNTHSGSASLAMNWTVPSGFDCSPYLSWRSCMESYKYSPIQLKTLRLPQLPDYRFAHRAEMRFWLKESAFMELEQALPGFRLESGMACSLGSLFHLSPFAAQYEPRLFTSIFPLLRDESALTVALYVRTGLTDVVADKEQKREDVPLQDPTSRFTKSDTVACALFQEHQHLKKNAAAGLPYSQVIWMVLTDSKDVKQWITEKYSGEDVYLNISAGREQGMLPQVVKRKVLTTASRGVHTRVARHPSTAEFAEAMIDWYLIGESDLVVGNGPSFGATGALRTARPYYDLVRCSLIEMVH